MNLVKFGNNLPASGHEMEPGTPLWQVVPTRDANGRPLADFMMLIPKLNKSPQHIIDITLINLQKVLEKYEDVVFVNFNMKINVLWVSVNAKHGLIPQMVTSIQNRVPQALLVSHQ
jgi:hypothetical protein